MPRGLIVLFVLLVGAGAFGVLIYEMYAAAVPMQSELFRD